MEVDFCQGQEKILRQAQTKQVQIYMLLLDLQTKSPTWITRVKSILTKLTLKILLKATKKLVKLVILAAKAQIVTIKVPKTKDHLKLEQAAAQMLAPQEDQQQELMTQFSRSATNSSNM